VASVVEKSPFGRGRAGGGGLLSLAKGGRNNAKAKSEKLCDWWEGGDRSIRGGGPGISCPLY